MSGLGWAALGAVVLLSVVVVLLIRSVYALGSVVDELTLQVSDLRDQVVPALSEARRSLKTAENQAVKADALLTVATSLTSTADHASKLAYRVVTNPFIKVLAFVSGTRRAASKIRKN
jgi:hypothetical protein